MHTHDEFLKHFLLHQDNIRAFLASVVRNHQDCDDVFQETALTLWSKFSEFDPNRSFGAWARGIAANKVLQWRDRLGRRPTPFSNEAIVAIQDAFQRLPASHSESLDALGECIGQMPNKSRCVLQLRYVERWPVSKIAAEIGCTPEAASKNLSRLRLKLYDCVQRRLDNNEARKDS